MPLFRRQGRRVGPAPTIVCVVLPHLAFEAVVAERGSGSVRLVGSLPCHGSRSPVIVNPQRRWKRTMLSL
ncbi:hypothetical protein B4N89_36850 [Embleya scabrispora]|uniref:Uncharacterized protein n=1 Tax=Embleya scabrispora TaxID=159449 RepID=A0A1T3NMA1_9ACTN|nr:hypothetical protein B4N89_36850 [Embleya scabrispora]